MGKISAEMISSLPCVDILELGHPVIDGLDARSPLIELVPAKSNVLLEKSLMLEFADHFFCLLQDSLCSLLYLTRQFIPFEGQRFNMALKTVELQQRVDKMG